MNIDDSSTALMVMDMQAMILGNFTENKEIIGNIKKCISTARENQIPVLYVVLGFRPGFPEISENSRFSAFKERKMDQNRDEMTKVHPQIAPLPTDIIITKRRVSAFTGSDLDIVLRANNIKHLVLTGVSTSGVVLSTFTEAADKDYKLTVISNACKDRNMELHQALITNFFSKRATVTTTEKWGRNSL